jgi:hypothetical protein
MLALLVLASNITVGTSTVSCEQNDQGALLEASYSALQTVGLLRVSQ